MSSRSSENVPVNPHTFRQNRSRRSQGKILAPLADSSEEDASPHSSIYEAPLASDSETEGIGSPTGKRSSDFITVSSRSIGVDDTSLDDELSRDDGLVNRGDANAAAGVGDGVSRSSDQRRSIRLSQGLETIVERKRQDAMREDEEAAFMRLDRRSSTEFSEDEDDDGSSLLRARRRKKAQTESSRSDYFDYYHDDEVYDYASPSQPLYQSISALNNADSPLAPSSPLLGGTPPISASFFNRNYSPSSPIRTPLQGPTFRPPVSGYRSYGTLTNHPFHNAPLARGDRGEGTNSSIGIGGYPATGTSTPDSLRSGARSRSASVTDSSGGGIIDKWRIWRVCGIFCCLGRRDDDEDDEDVRGHV